MAKIPAELFKRIRRIEITTSKLVDELLRGAYHSAFKGQGIEFEEVRAYEPGDDVRSIDWNVTARSQFPYIKRFQEERELTVMLVVDLSASSLFGSGKRSKRDLIAEVGATLAFSAVKNNDKTGLLLYTDEVELYLPPKKGLRHVLRIIRELLAFEPKGKGSDLSAALKYLGKVQRKMAVCFLLSDFFDFEKIQHSLTIAAKSYDLVAVHAVDLREKQIPRMGLVEFSDLETGETIMIDTSQRSWREDFERSSKQRSKMIKHFMGKIGAGFIELRTDRSFASSIGRYFKLRGMK